MREEVRPGQGEQRLGADWIGVVRQALDWTGWATHGSTHCPSKWWAEVGAWSGGERFGKSGNGEARLLHSASKDALQSGFASQREREETMRIPSRPCA